MTPTVRQVTLADACRHCILTGIDRHHATVEITAWMWAEMCEARACVSADDLLHHRGQRGSG